MFTKLEIMFYNCESLLFFPNLNNIHCLCHKYKMMSKCYSLSYISDDISNNFRGDDGCINLINIKKLNNL